MKEFPVIVSSFTGVLIKKSFVVFLILIISLLLFINEYIQYSFEMERVSEIEKILELNLSLRIFEGNEFRDMNNVSDIGDFIEKHKYGDLSGRKNMGLRHYITLMRSRECLLKEKKVLLRRAIKRNKIPIIGKFFPYPGIQDAGDVYRSLYREEFGSCDAKVE